MPPIEQQYAAQHAPQPQAQAQPQQQHSSQPPQAQQQQQQQQHVYYDQSFPQAPAAVFPDAPSDEISNNTGHVEKEKEEPKEALLIEL
jgi:growth factor-regulated tyrosine kinase substrate